VDQLLSSHHQATAEPANTDLILPQLRSKLEETAIRSRTAAVRRHPTTEPFPGALQSLRSRRWSKHALTCG